MIAGACGPPELAPGHVGAEALGDAPSALVQLPAATLSARSRHIAAPLPDGKVLVGGGRSGSGDILATCEIYDPITNAAVSPAPTPLAYSRYEPTATHLPTAGGETLITGGYGSLGAVGPSARFNPVSSGWSSAASLTPARYQHTATLLPSGAVLVVGGQDNSGNLLDAVASYDPATDAWTTRPAIQFARARHGATALLGGGIMVAGGYVGVGTGSTGDVRILDASMNAWTAADPLNYVRNQHTITLLQDGDVLAVGYDDHVERYDPAADAWAVVAPLGAFPDRYRHTATLLPNGCVFVAGGQVGPSGNATYVPDVQLYDPEANTWASSLPLAVARSRHTATLLDGGVVLLVGGESTGPTAVSTAERYALRTNGTACATRCDCLSGFCVDGVCCDSACDSGACATCLAAEGAPVDGVCTPLGAGTCDDGNLCTQGDACTGNVCSGAPVDCPPPGACQAPGQCDPASGQCGYSLLPNGTACVDEDPCTESSACEDGACVGVAQIVCPPGGPCEEEEGACQPSTGQCAYAHKPPGTPCSGGTCIAGACVPDTASEERRDGSAGDIDGAPADSSGCACRVSSSPAGRAPIPWALALLIAGATRLSARASRSRRSSRRVPPR